MSPEDGQLDPRAVLLALLQETRRDGVQCLADQAAALERDRTWRVRLARGQRLDSAWMVFSLGWGLVAF